MPKAKTIDRVEYTKRRFLNDDIPTNRAFTEQEMERLVHHGAETCPVCGAELIHESGCVRCTCGWSRC